MARHKDMNVSLPDGTPNPGGGHTHSWNVIHTALLMDIRDELKRLNNLLHCSNFIGIPRTLHSIRRAVAQPRKPSAKRK